MPTFCSIFLACTLIANPEERVAFCWEELLPITSQIMIGKPENTANNNHTNVTQAGLWEFPKIGDPKIDPNIL